MYRSSAAVCRVKLEATVEPLADVQPLPLLTFQHHPPTRGPSEDGADDQLADPFGALVSSASVDKMREILNVLNDGHGDGDGRRATAQEEAAEKRRKHREAMVLFRLRKKMNFGDMKKQEQTLQDVLQLQLHEYRRLRDRPLTERDDDSSLPDNVRMRALLDEFADVLTFKESLLRENRAMEGVISELAKFQKLVVDEVERQSEEEKTGSAESSPTKATARAATSRRKLSSPVGEWAQFLENEPPIYYVPETAASCGDFAREGFQRVTQLRHGFKSGRFDMKQMYCLGWQAQHSVALSPEKKRVLRFRFTRQVPRSFMELDDFRRLAWPVVTTPELNTRLYSAPVHMKVLQWVSDDSFITLRNSPHRDRGFHLRYFAFNTRLDYDDDLNRRAFMIHHSILDREPVAQSSAGQPVVWIKEGAQSMTFTEMPENDSIEIEHIGYMLCVNEEQARYLLVETCNILMRWEHIVVPPRLLRAD